MSTESDSQHTTPSSSTRTSPTGLEEHNVANGVTSIAEYLVSPKFVRSPVAHTVPTAHSPEMAAWTYFHWRLGWFKKDQEHAQQQYEEVLANSLLLQSQYSWSQQQNNAQEARLVEKDIEIQNLKNTNDILMTEREHLQNLLTICSEQMMQSLQHPLPEYAAFVECALAYSFVNEVSAMHRPQPHEYARACVSITPHDTENKCTDYEFHVTYQCLFQSDACHRPYDNFVIKNTVGDLVIRPHPGTLETVICGSKIDGQRLNLFFQFDDRKSYLAFFTML